MSDYAEVAAVLRHVADLVDRDDADTGWSSWDLQETSIASGWADGFLELAARIDQAGWLGGNPR